MKVMTRGEKMNGHETNIRLLEENLFMNKTIKHSLEDNSIKLSGTFSSDELRAIAKDMDTEFQEVNEPKRIENLNIAGFTANKVKVQSFVDEGRHYYSFYIIKGSEAWDFFYGSYDEGTKDWWPKTGSFSPFIPRGFIEVADNQFEYPRGHKKALKMLEACGFSVEELKERKKQRFKPFVEL